QQASAPVDEVVAWAVTCPSGRTTAYMHPDPPKLTEPGWSARPLIYGDTAHTCSNCEGVSPESCLFNQHPAAVDDAMVERAVAGYAASPWAAFSPEASREAHRERMRAALQ